MSSQFPGRGMSSMSLEYTYYAILDRSHTLENPLVVVRERGSTEEMFTTNLKWERSDVLYRISSGRDYADAVPITAADAKRFEKVQAKRVKKAKKEQG